MKSVLLATLLACLASLSSATPSCPEPGKLSYPLGELIEKEGLALEFDFDQTDYYDFGSPAHVRQRRDAVLKNLEGKSQAERDALLLGRLSWSTIGTLPLLGITTFPDAGLFDTYLDVLDRHQMTGHATALRSTRAAFPLWDTTAQARYKQWNPAGGSDLNPILDAVLRAQSHAFKTVQPPLLTKAQDILENDAAYPTYLAKLENVGFDIRYSYMMAQISACVAPYDTPEQADKALAALPPTLADFHVIHLFLQESGNGGMHQYIFNSTGMLAPQLAEILTRWALPDHARAVRKAMGYFPAPYPRDTPQRRDNMLKFTPAIDEAVNVGTWISDDPGIWNAVKARAKDEGYWPQ